MKSPFHANSEPWIQRLDEANDKSASRSVSFALYLRGSSMGYGGALHWEQAAYLSQFGDPPQVGEPG